MMDLYTQLYGSQNKGIREVVTADELMRREEALDWAVLHFKQCDPELEKTLVPYQGVWLEQPSNIATGTIWLHEVA